MKETGGDGDFLPEPYEELPTARDLASALTVLSIVKAAVVAEDVRLRTMALETLQRHLSEHGSDSVLAYLPDGTKIGKLSLRNASESVRVTDERAFLAWVKAERPDEVVESVRDSYRKAVLADVKKTGEVPPGVEIVYGSATIALSPITREARDAVLLALRGGKILLPGSDR